MSPEAGRASFVVIRGGGRRRAAGVYIGNSSGGIFCCRKQGQFILFFVNATKERTEGGPGPGVGGFENSDVDCCS